MQQIRANGDTRSLGKLTAGSLQPEEQARLCEDVVTLALEPILFFLGLVPIRQERRKIFGLQINEGARRHKVGEFGLGRSGDAVSAPGYAKRSDRQQCNQDSAFHGFPPGFAGDFAGAAVWATRRGRTTRSCSNSACRIGVRAAFVRWRLRRALTS